MGVSGRVQAEVERTGTGWSGADTGWSGAGTDWSGAVTEVSLHDGVDTDVSLHDWRLVSEARCSGTGVELALLVSMETSR